MHVYLFYIHLNFCPETEMHAMVVSVFVCIHYAVRYNRDWWKRIRNEEQRNRTEHASHVAHRMLVDVIPLRMHKCTCNTTCSENSCCTRCNTILKFAKMKWNEMQLQKSLIFALAEIPCLLFAWFIILDSLQCLCLGNNCQRGYVVFTPLKLQNVFAFFAPRKSFKFTSEISQAVCARASSTHRWLHHVLCLRFFLLIFYVRQQYNQKNSN